MLRKHVVTWTLAVALLGAGAYDIYQSFTSQSQARGGGDHEHAGDRETGGTHQTWCDMDPSCNGFYHIINYHYPRSSPYLALEPVRVPVRTAQVVHVKPKPRPKPQPITVPPLPSAPKQTLQPPRFGLPPFAWLFGING